MSKKKFVEYKGNGFWAYDVAFGVFLKHLIDVAEEESAHPNWLAEAIQCWRVLAVADFQPFIDKSWSSEQLRTFIRLASEATRRISQRESFTATELESWNILEGEGIFPRGDQIINTAAIVELGDAIVALAAGKLPDALPGRVWLFGTPYGRRTIRLRT